MLSLLIITLLLSPLLALAFTPPPPTFLRSTSLNALQHATSIDFPSMDGSKVRVGIIRTRWNPEPVGSLLDGCKSSLAVLGVKDENVFVTEVPGAYELPYASRLLAMSGTVDVIIAIGVLVKGDTMHFEYIADSVTKGIMNVGLTTNVPVIFGVLTCLTDGQVTDRSTGPDNHGIGWGKSAVEMALLREAAVGGGGSKQTMGFGAAVRVEGGKGAAKIGF